MPVHGLGGETIDVAVPAGIQSGTALRLRRKGMPRVRGAGKGDLFLVAEVQTPVNLTPEQRRLLEQLEVLEGAKATGTDSPVK